MKLITVYLLILLLGETYFVLLHIIGALPIANESLRIGTICGAVGGVGGCIYCLRAIYLNACVRKNWDKDWEPWYYIRPIVSIASGVISFLFLKAGLLILESGINPDSSELGFYALAFIAGLNVDKFVTKVEDVAQAVWGIEKSRTAKDSANLPSIISETRE